MSCAPRNKALKEDDWERQKDAIKSLFVYKNVPIKDIPAIMAREHSFSASQSQYLLRVRKWGFHQKQNRKKWRAIGHRVEKRKMDGKESEVYINGKLIEMKKVQEGVSRSCRLITSEESTRVSSPELPEDVTVTTPRLTNLVSPLAPEQVLDDLRVPNVSVKLGQNSIPPTAPQSSRNDAAVTAPRAVEPGPMVSPPKLNLTEHDAPILGSQPPIDVNVSKSRTIEPVLSRLPKKTLTEPEIPEISQQQRQGIVQASSSQVSVHATASTAQDVEPESSSSPVKQNLNQPKASLEHLPYFRDFPQLEQKGCNIYTASIFFSA
ncbi:hypothetical protein AJ79_01636 [Helicocarpus griseus UAMH5409]|uniref:Clr5 domain-containing protein n=1 Tax=Helicocarpus griseus UAMH5409 TaxID=1447875 RepID=A0A2B7Y6A4_9EURO|nr:hypothetical protein AJ79_01636 [Helicocarpus griseus UAMH5409]